MKENKVNVELIVPSIGKRYNIFIPVNKTIGEVIAILNNSINEITSCFPINNKLALFNVMENEFYNYDVEVINTGIKNGTILALI
ncbi:MAG: hypothetical protein E7170_03395 [Firmicutes bacterium]|nr:hypothetical protein [Bacillota bacterium]